MQLIRAAFRNDIWRATAFFKLCVWPRYTCWVPTPCTTKFCRKVPTHISKHPKIFQSASTLNFHRRIDKHTCRRIEKLRFPELAKHWIPIVICCLWAPQIAKQKIKTETSSEITHSTAQSTDGGRYKKQGLRQPVNCRVGNQLAIVWSVSSQTQRHRSWFHRY